MSKVRDVRSKPVPVMLDKQRSLHFDLNAFAELEDMFGSIDDAMREMEKGSVKAIRAVLWAGLLHEIPEGETFTIHDAGRLISIADLPMVSEALTEAIGVATPQVDETVDSNEAPQGNEKGVRALPTGGTGPGSSI